METEEAIRSRRTVKAFEPEPLDPETLDELLELARWAPNHHLTNPWRFRILGQGSLMRLEQAAGELAIREAPGSADPEAIARTAATKLRRAPTLVVCTVARSDDPLTEEEDRAAAACAAYIVLLAAHDRGLGGYWRTPSVLRDASGRAAVGIGENEHFVGLLYLGRPSKQVEAPARREPEGYIELLD